MAQSHTESKTNAFDSSNATFLHLPGPEYKLVDPSDMPSILELMRARLKDPPYSFRHPFFDSNLDRAQEELELVRFLRARKYDVERACKMITEHYRFRFDVLGLKDKEIPYSVIHDAMETGFLVIYPTMKDREGRQIIYVRPGEASEGGPLSPNQAAN
ncbi:hypothetical protein HDU93_004339 [Gonapodya sp. JEL0774]|nr:hypothetical protein HDU93_004339 [Gonapodya sp. JEL0774]